MPPRRKPGVLLPLEAVILGLALEHARQGDAEFYGFALADRLSKGDNALIGYGALYRTLGRMERAGLLASRWENPELSIAEGRPRRRLYHVTASGTRALAKARATDPLLIHLRELFGEA